MPSGPILLIDGSSYLFRAFFAVPNLTTAAGEPTGAIRGTIMMIDKLVRRYPDSPVAVVFDPKGDTFRNEIYPEYKANRPPTPPELVAQIAPIHEIIRAMGLALIIKEGVEADDVIGTFARMATDAKRETIISSSDKDMAQLVNEHVTVVDSMSDKTFDIEGVREKFGVEPHQVIDSLALSGDTSDNIPGIEKVGPKTAAKWLQQYGTVENIIEHAEEFGGKIGENLRRSLDMLPVSKDLATIRTQLDLGTGLDDLNPKPPDVDKLREIYQRLEFRTLLEKLLPDVEADAAVPAPEDAPQEVNYELIVDESHLDAWIERLKSAGEFAIDTETTSTMPMQARLVGISFACEPGHAAYVPFGHTTLASAGQLPRETVLAKLRPLIEDDALPKIGQHFKYDTLVLGNAGIEVKGRVSDTQIESFVLNSSATRHNMTDMAKHYLGATTTAFKDVAGRGKKQISFHEVELETAADYAAEDADITLRLHRHLAPQLAEVPELQSLYESVELPLASVLARMEHSGALIDGEALAHYSFEMGEAIKQLREQIHEEAGEAFNLDSPKQLQHILFDRRGLRVVKRSPKTKLPSTDESVLEELAREDALPRLILDYRSLAKLKSTYTDRLPEQINPETGRVHTSYHQCVASTGRLASSDPNLQNIPIRTPEGRRIRQAFVAPEGYCLVAADYSQIELRIMAHLSHDQHLIEYFNEGRDVHAMTASEVFEVAVDAVSDEERRIAKMINFGLMYGMGAFGLAQRLGIPRSQAQSYMTRYFNRYSGVRAFMDEIKARARAAGYVETIMGRRVYLPGIATGRPKDRASAERLAINAPMQGSAADIIKKAMIDIDAWLQAGEVEAKMIMQVHDELVFEVRDGEADTLIAGVTERMESAVPLIVPLPVSVGRGANWDEAH
ncbi:MAG: DNA polymerase I [Gammaproteobacteria bacterium]|nr:DNA polymerase I [Gammaproteobacteria bacterium]